MPPRFILHIVLTILLLVIGWWLYMQVVGNTANFSSIVVATYWFAALVFIFFSWLFYWFVHRLSNTAWMIAFIIALAIAMISTLALLYISKENQKKLEEESLRQKQEQAAESESQLYQTQPSDSNKQIETLNLGE